MPEDADYHDTLAAREMALATQGSCAVTRHRHLELADHHFTVSRAIRNLRTRDRAMHCDTATATAIKRSIDLIGDTHRMLQDTRTMVKYIL